MNVYETFHRADGSVVQGTALGDGNIVFHAPGNVYSGVSSLDIRKGKARTCGWCSTR